MDWGKEIFEIALSDLKAKIKAAYKCEKVILAGNKFYADYTKDENCVEIGKLEISYDYSENNQVKVHFDFVPTNLVKLKDAIDALVG